LPNTRSFIERMGALKNLWPFLTMVWRTNRSLTAASLLLRLARALLPVITLYVGKLIIDDVVMLVQMPDKPGTLLEWIDSDLLDWSVSFLSPSSPWRCSRTFSGVSSR
jgi:ATP-binding cassette subfamily B protein